MTGNITTSTGKAFVVGTMSAEALTALFDLRWMLVLIVVLIVADFWFGVSESLKSMSTSVFREQAEERATRRWTTLRISYSARCSVWLSSNRSAGRTT